jgi:small subunit ribosomal protein S23
VERNVAREEALSTGAYFGKNQLDVGMELENAEFERWKTWAKSQVALADQTRRSAYTGVSGEGAEEEGASAPDALNAAIDGLTAPRDAAAV